MKKLVLAGAFAASMVGTTSSAQGTLGASSLVNMLPLVAIVATVGLASSSGTQVTLQPGHACRPDCYAQSGKLFANEPLFQPMIGIE